MAVNIIYYVHGTTTDNAEHKSTGWIPGELSEKGITQVNELKKQTHPDELDLVISSDLKRAVDSANILFEGLVKIELDKRIRECNYGDLNGQDSSLVRYEDHITVPFPNGESLKDVEKRVRELCEYLLANYDGNTVAFVAHKAPQLALEVITNGLTWEEAIDRDWRKTKAWQPGWKYTIEREKILEK